ncbi:hypothetical protein BEWA_053700 [Theileria equi strain WA]|uniref:Uncharacterized protein n=1 Tax=Theileria equi strain WA TaxID=1537102 RepID=L1LDK1_THEEQ|nr:hypothetical protein BEWA_053700 [Theileria equi strain WA]EKX73315.1 hypothetical protein BEWA_053700 [Theileria equi strain WA]|eukprot:XP_004832767.1 hypothetical protein BEWA_053700 [Theileria equi strain WA]
MDSSDFKQKFTTRIKSHTHRLYSSHHPVVKADLKNNFVDIWKENLGTITLGTIYGIKILKLLIYIRYLLEWLPQVNPYLPPFDTIYQTTDAYLKVFQLFLPRVAGVDTSGIIAWFILENIEAFLSTKPEIANSLQ